MGTRQGSAERARRLNRTRRGRRAAWTGDGARAPGGRLCNVAATVFFGNDVDSRAASVATLLEPTGDETRTNVRASASLASSPQLGPQAAERATALGRPRRSASTNLNPARGREATKKTVKYSQRFLHNFTRKRGPSPQCARCPRFTRVARKETAHCAALKLPARGSAPGTGRDLFPGHPLEFALSPHLDVETQASFPGGRFRSKFCRRLVFRFGEGGRRPEFPAYV
jgi:hypothetical protein